MATASKPKCNYWEKCYRKDATHKNAFLHPGDCDPSVSKVKKAPNLKDKRVVFTGALSKLTRTKATADAETYGCIVTKAVSSKTDIVVVGEGAGQKIDNAIELGIDVYEEDEWLEMLESASPLTMEELQKRSKSDNISDSEEEMEISVNKNKTSPPKKSPTKRLAKVHDLSDTDDDEGPSPPKKQKESTETAANCVDLNRKTQRSNRKKCKYWGKCYRKDPIHLKDFKHPTDSDADEEEMDTTDGASAGAIVKQKNKMADGETVEIKSGLHGTNVYRIKRTGETYYCTCAGWKNQKRAVNMRTCRHLQIHLGEDFEKSRVGDTGSGWTGSNLKNSQRAPRHKNIGSLLLAHKWTESQNPKGWWLSEKLDGVRAFWDGKAFYSRLGNEFIPPTWFTKDFPSDMEIDGELFGGRGKFQSTVSIVKNAGSDAWKNIKYMIFDAPHLTKQPFEKRIEACKTYFDEHEVKYAEVLKHEKCQGQDHLKEELEKVEQLGGEGLMIREPGSKYEHARSKSLLKIKTFHDAEALVIGHEKGKGRNSHRCGAIRCRMECGKEFSVGTGLCDKDRDHPPKKGSIITYKFQEYTNDGIPRFPVYLGVRIDGDSAKDAVLPKKPE